MYFYHAHAFSFGGRFILPADEVIAPPAACCLPITGGNESCQFSNFNYQGKVDAELSFISAHLNVTSSEDKGVHTTHTTSTIEGLNIMGYVKADKITAQIDSSHDPTKDDEPSIITSKSEFANLTIAGHRIDLEFSHATFDSFQTYKSLQTAFSGEPREEILGCMMGCRLPENPSAPKHLQAVYNNFKLNSQSNLKAAVLCSLVKKVSNPDTKDFTTFGPVVVVPNFGTVYLGEMMIVHGRRRLHMLRVEMGSPVTGSFAFSGGDTNGTDIPPH